MFWDKSDLKCFSSELAISDRILLLCTVSLSDLVMFLCAGQSGMSDLRNIRQLEGLTWGDLLEQGLGLLPFRQ